MKADQVKEILSRFSSPVASGTGISVNAYHFTEQGINEASKAMAALINEPSLRANSGSDRFGLIVDHVRVNEPWWKSSGPLLLESETYQMTEHGIVLRLASMKKGNSFAGRRMEVVRLIGCGTPEEFEARL